MSRNSMPVKLIGIAILAVVLAGCGATVRPGQRGIKYWALRSPGLQKEVKREGFYFLWPWNGMVRYDVTWQSRTEKLDILTSDALHIQTSLTVTFRPKADQIYALHTEVGPDYYDRIVRPSFLAISRSEFARHEHNALAKDEPEIEERILEVLRSSVDGKPIEIDKVAIEHIEYDRNVSAAISTKLATSQKVEQKDAEVRIAERDADIARTVAKGRADAVRIEAEGESAAMVLKGEAQKKAQAEITKTLSASYLRYKAFDGNATRFYFVPVGKDGMPIIVDAGGEPHARR